MCSDFNDYVCKYYTGVPALSLFNEFIAAKFLVPWRLKVPDFAIVDITEEHVPQEFRSSRMQSQYFSRPCFGSKHQQYAKEIDPSFPNLEINKKILNAIENRYDLLKIGLFDLWLANEDRNHNNYNLLLSSTESGYHFTPIDHERCFNGSSANLERPLTVLTEDESLITSPLAQHLLRGTKGLEEKIEEIASGSYFWVAECHKCLENTLNDLPETWGIDKPGQIAFMSGTLFTQEWLSLCIETFKEYADRYLLQ